MGDKSDRTLYCGNLADETTEDLLYELFLQGGPLESVKIPKDGDRNRNFAFITFKHAESVPYCIALFQNTSLFGKELRLDFRKNTGERNVYLEIMMVVRNKRGHSHSTPRNHFQEPPLLQNYDNSNRFDRGRYTDFDYHQRNEYMHGNQNFRRSLPDIPRYPDQHSRRVNESPDYRWSDFPETSRDRYQPYPIDHRRPNNRSDDHYTPKLPHYRQQRHLF